MILIVGAGLAGMSTAYHLGDEPHLVVESESTPGGLCRSREVDGFTFDFTGHLLHLRDPRATALVDDLLPDGFATIERDARIRTRGVTLPFPFQANLHGLPPDVVAECLLRFVESRSLEVPTDPETSFEDWSLAVFGSGISEAFLWPYNTKLFRKEPTEMTADWVSWAVPRPTLEQVVRGAVGVENRGMGYNSTFRYPREGGIGVLPLALAERVPNVRLGTRVEEVDLDGRTARLQGGETLDWERLVVTSPLPSFLKTVRGGPPGLDRTAGELEWSVVHCLNLGIERPGVGDGAHWIYFPDEEVPFYRAGFPSNFSSSVMPPGMSSMYVEFGFPRNEEPDRAELERRTIEALRREGILEQGDRIPVRDWVRIDPGYVVFDRSRQRALRELMPGLERWGVHPIGRYGAWTYSYMERALLDGMELADRLSTGGWNRMEPTKR
jgi:protoporphyrinogen oxidase